jgi:hypothetical protein
METSPDNPPSRQSDGGTCVQPEKRRTWLPILLGVLCGMIACLLLASLESPAFYHVTVWIFNETSPKRLFITPGYDCVQFAILLALAAIGGCIGVRFSRWRKETSFLFLLAILLVIAVFAALGRVFDAPGSLWDALGFH